MTIFSVQPTSPAKSVQREIDGLLSTNGKQVLYSIASGLDLILTADDSYTSQPTIKPSTHTKGSSYCQTIYGI